VGLLQPGRARRQDLLEFPLRKQRGNLYKAVDGLVNPIVSDFVWYGSDPALYYDRYELKTDDSSDPWTDLVAVIDSLNNPPDPARPFLRWSTSTASTARWPPTAPGQPGLLPRELPQLLHLLHTATGKMEWVVWDAGMSFGRISAPPPTMRP